MKILKIMLFIGLYSLINFKSNAQSIKSVNGELIIKPSPTSAEEDFDFLEGKWNVKNRKLTKRFAGSNQWMNFPATLNMEKIVLGKGNTESFKATVNGRPFEGMTLRLFNPATKLWSIYWADSNTGTLDKPVVGSFEGNVGTFYANDVLDGKKIVVKYIWNKQNPENPVWSQAFSKDGGKTWEWNWYMEFSKINNGLVVSLPEQRVRVLELRNYELKPGKLNDFMELFKHNFYASQEHLGAYVLGLFDVTNSGNRFYWMRGFESMHARGVFLPAFYYNSTPWHKHRTDANNMIVDNDSVLLVRPLGDTGIRRALIFGDKKMLVIANYYWAKNKKLEQLISLYQEKIKPFLNASNVPGASLWVTEMKENDFPKLPVIQNKNLLVVLTPYADVNAYNAVRDKLSAFMAQSGIDDMVDKKEVLLLNAHP